MSNRSLGRQVAHPSAFAKRVQGPKCQAALLCQSEYCAFHHGESATSSAASRALQALLLSRVTLRPCGQMAATFCRQALSLHAHLFTPDPSHSIVQGSCWLETWID